jgi:hypothetical protein
MTDAPDTRATYAAYLRGDATLEDVGAAAERSIAAHLSGGAPEAGEAYQAVRGIFGWESYYTHGRAPITKDDLRAYRRFIVSRERERARALVAALRAEVDSLCLCPDLCEECDCEGGSGRWSDDCACRLRRSLAVLAVAGERARTALDTYEGQGETEMKAARRRFPHDLGGDEGRLAWHRAHPEQAIGEEQRP